ncbi:hypothetical protein LINPERPRIM_LOCUS2083 [Linum perenne]
MERSRRSATPKRAAAPERVAAPERASRPERAPNRFSRFRGVGGGRKNYPSGAAGKRIQRRSFVTHRALGIITRSSS